MHFQELLKMVLSIEAFYRKNSWKTLHQFKKLEEIIHPLVREQEVKFIEKNLNSGKNVIVLEVPLLFETGMDELVDLTLVVSTAKEIRDKRVLERPGMTRKKLDAILSRQMPDELKREKADFIIDTGGEIEDTWNQIDNVLASLTEKTPEAFKLWELTDIQPSDS